MKDQLLDIEVRLLVIRYGRESVLEAIEQLPSDSSEPLLEQASSRVRSAEAKRPRKRQRPLTDLVEDEFADRPEVLGPLRILARGFENRSFLPNLRDVQRFLARSDDLPRHIKSRATAGPHVVRMLANMPAAELATISARQERGSESDFELLSRAIMGPSRD